jgi:HTH-type transcriptional regulator / antitoxin HipB
MIRCRRLTTFEEARVRLRTAVDFGAVVRERRRRLGLSQATLARRVGVGREWIIEAEKGKSGAPLKLVLRTLEALGLTLSAQTAEDPEKKTGSKNSGRGLDLDSVLRHLQRKKR